MSATAKTKRCPLCGKETAASFHPFCGPRCAKIDLGRWLSQAYTVQTEDSPPAADDSENAP